MKSEIFDEYFKISVAKEEEEKNKPRKNPRDNAMSEKELAELYNLKPETHKDMQYDYNIVEIAHPESLIVSPSYDPANGLFGNQNENHSRNLHIVNKEPRGILDGHISSRAELISVLMKTANYMDALDKDELRALADACLYQISNEPTSINSIIKKKAFLGAIGPALKGISILVGLWQGAHLLQDVLPKSDSGMNSSFNKLLESIDDVKESNTNFGVGVEFKDSFKNILDQIKNTVINYQTNYDEHSELITSVQVSNASDLFNKKNELKNSQKVIESLKENSLIMKEFLFKVIKLLQNSSFINNHVFDKGSLTSTVEDNAVLNFANTILNPFNSDVINPLIQSCESYMASINSLIESLSKSQEDSKKSEEMAETELGKLPEFKNYFENNKNDVEEKKEDFDLKSFFQ